LASAPTEFDHLAQLDRLELELRRLGIEAGERPQTIFRVNTEVARSQQKRLRALKAERDGRSVAAALARLEEAARGDGNLMPAILEAVKTYATLGEISDAMRKVFGEYRALSVV